MERLAFLQAYLRDWRTIGSVTPSSHYLARRMTSLMDPERASLVVELGAGTGAITGPLLERLPAHARLLAVEIYPPFAEHLRRRFPDRRLEVIAGTAADVPQYLAERGLPSADYVVSSIPFSTLPPDVRHAIIGAAYAGLKPGGEFIAYQYSPFHLEPVLRAYFPQVSRRLLVPNIPPAFVYHAVRPAADIHGWSATESGQAMRHGQHPAAAQGFPVADPAAGAALRAARGPALALLALALLGFRVRPSLGLASALAIPALLYLFRDPDRMVPQQQDALLAPADGRVLSVRPVFDEHWQQEMWEVVIFLSLLDVHVQRSPLAGKVIGTSFQPGAHRPALWPSASERNERLHVYLQGEIPVTVTQVAGVLARSIVSWVEPGQELAAGQRLGMIKLGSQTHLRFPRRFAPLVGPGDRVVGGLTPLARIRDAATT